MTSVTDPDTFVIHSGTTIGYADDVFLTLIGAESRDQIIGADLTAIIEPEFHDQLQRQIDQIDTGDASALGLAVELQTLSGTRRNAIAVSSSVEWDGTDQIQTTFLTLAGETLTPTRTMRGEAMDQAPIGITISDPSQPDNPIIYANDGFCNITGYPLNEVLGRNCRFLQGAETRAAPVDEMRAAIDAEDPVTVELRNYRKDGTMFWNRVSISPVRDPEGALRYYVGFQQDISDTKLYEHEKDLFKEQAKVADQCMFITDREGTIEYVNPAFERVTGYTAEEAVGETPRILKSGQQDETFYEDLWETITRGEIWEAQPTNTTKDGRQYEVSQRIVPIADDREEITHFAAIETDITDRIVREQTLDVLNRVLRHNLREAITVIEGYANLLETKPEVTDRQVALQMIQTQTAKMTKIAETTAKIRGLSERGRAIKSWDVEYLRSLIHSYQNEYPDARISLRTDIDEGAQLSNAELVEILLDEAVENAVIHSDQETPTVTIELKPAASPEQVAIVVADDGPGIPEHEHEPIEEGEETPLVHSSGLGLWLLNWVTTRLGGEFEISANQPRGTRLRFRLPIVSSSGLTV